jgi:agmatine deiminase
VTPVRLPAEWEPHERTLMGWPCRSELWGPTMAQAREDYATVANAIAAFEPVTMIANPGEDAAGARAACSGGVEVVELPIDDSWLRDSGPIYVYDSDGGDGGRARVAIHFGFNAWGEKFPPWDRDAAIGGLIAGRLGDPVVDGGIILEGGSISPNGGGVILTTEQCLLDPSRNPSLSREQIQSVLCERFGLREIVWLGQGLVEDRDTDGHVDLIAAFCSPDAVLIQMVEPENPNYDNCFENRARLEAAGIEAIPVSWLPYATVAGEKVAVSYLNLYVCNGAVIVGVSGAPSDADALAVIGGAFPGREVVAVPGSVLAFGGGGPHCITQQVPAQP